MFNQYVFNWIFSLARVKKNVCLISYKWLQNVRKNRVNQTQNVSAKEGDVDPKPELGAWKAVAGAMEMGKVAVNLAVEAVVAHV